MMGVTDKATAPQLTTRGAPKATRVLSPTTTLVGSPSTQAQITSLTFALHSQRTRYESLAGQVVQQQNLWEDTKALYEAKIAEQTREREEFEKRIRQTRGSM